MKNIKFYKKILPLVVASTLTLTGCGAELGSDISDYDVLETVNNEEGFTGVEQIVEVPHESFCLRINYTSGETTSIDSLYPFYVGNFNNVGSVFSTGFSGKIY